MAASEKQVDRPRKSLENHGDQRKKGSANIASTQYQQPGSKRRARSLPSATVALQVLQIGESHDQEHDAEHLITTSDEPES